jgi:hypothetical protein
MSWMIDVWSINTTFTPKWTSFTCAGWPGASWMLFPGQYISTSGMTNLLPPGIRNPDHPARSLFPTRPEIVSCRLYCSYHCDLNVQKWWTSEQTKNTYFFHRHSFVEYTAFAIHSSCVWKLQSKTKRSARKYHVPSPRPQALGTTLVWRWLRGYVLPECNSSTWS